MSKTSRMALMRYAIVSVTVFVAFALTWVLPWMRYHGSFLLFFAAVTFNAWYGGRGPGLFSCLLAGLLWDYYIFEPPGEFSFGADAIMPLAIFIVVTLLTGLLTTGLAEAEAKAREQQKWLQVTLSSIGDGVIATDATGRIKFMNGVAEELSGMKTSEALGHPLESVLNLQVNSLVTRPFSRVFSEKTKMDAPAGTVLISATGKGIPIEGNAAAITDANEAMFGVVIVFRDVHEREEAREKISNYQDRLRSMASDLLLSEERERRVIADGLHDRVGQSLALARIKLTSLRGHLSDGESISQVDEITQVLKQMIREIRSLTFELSPPILYEFGLSAALEWLATNVRNEHDLNCSFSGTTERWPFSPKTDVLLFQAVRELLTNVVKHSHARQAVVTVAKEYGRVSVTVRDDGHGFDVSEQSLGSERTKGFGLFSIRERVNHLGGSFEIRSEPGSGTCVSLALPLLV